MTADGELEHFWALARRHARMETLPGYLASNMGELVVPPAWTFGGTPEQADELLTLVLTGTKTAAASALWEFEADDEPLPEVGSLAIVLDSAGHPHALLRTSDVRIVPFDQVEEEHAFLEGEGDRSLAYWRTAHEHYLQGDDAHPRGFNQSMPVVLERFELLYSA
jgi:uncharacterized protein YhfF